MAFIMMEVRNRHVRETLKLAAPLLMLIRAIQSIIKVEHNHAWIAATLDLT